MRGFSIHFWWIAAKASSRKSDKLGKVGARSCLTPLSSSISHHSYLPSTIVQPLHSRPQLLQRCDELRSRGERIVFTNGCFDILHRGHVEYLEQAAALGDALVVAINSDESIRRLKGPDRPIVAEEDRAAIIAALRSVALVTIFSEETPLELIQSIRPDVLVKGGDYDPEGNDGPRYIVGSDLVRSYGGQVEVIDLVVGRSTTNIITRVLATGAEDERRSRH